MSGVNLFDFFLIVLIVSLGLFVIRTIELSVKEKKIKKEYEKRVNYLKTWLGEKENE